MKRLLLIHSAIFFCFFIQGQGLPEEQQSAINEYLSENINSNEPGVAIGIVKEGEIVFEKYIGLASLQHKVSISDSSRFNIASNAKQYTALCVLKLVLEKTISLEDDIRKYLPEFYANIDDPIRIRHLINHTSGIRDYCDLLSIQDEIWWKKVAYDNQDAMELIKKQRTLNFKPGSAYTYSNSNYTLLTELVARVSGKSFHEYSKELFLELGMKNTDYLEKYMNVIPNQAMPYANWGEWKQYPMVTKLFGDGFLFTTLKDQLIFEQAIQKASPENALLNTSQLPIENSEIATYGYGLELSKRIGRKAIHHEGATGAYNAQMIRFPEENISVVVMSNNNGISSYSVADDLAQIVLKELPPYPEVKVSGFIGEINFDLLVGTYETPKGNFYKIKAENEKLFFQSGNNNPWELTQVKGSLFQLGTTLLGFDGQTMSVFRQNGSTDQFRKLKDFTPKESDVLELVGTYTNDELKVSFKFINASSKLLIQQKGDEDTMEVNVLEKDRYMVWDYKLEVERDTTHHIEAVRLDFARLKNIRFRRVNPHVSDTKKRLEDGTMIQVGRTQESVGKGKGDILLTKNDSNGNEIWNTLIGGKGYDRPHMVKPTEDGGYLILGSTSSKGKGNYDAWLIKTNGKGKMEWDTTFGDEGNDYGYSFKELTNGTILVQTTNKIPEERVDAKRKLYLFDPDSAD